MEKQYKVSIFLDVRSIKTNDKFPVKLRVYNIRTKTKKLYNTGLDLTKNEFESIWKTKKPRNEYKYQRLELQKIENKANDISKEIKFFSFDEFESKFFRKKGDGENIYYHYEKIIERLKANHQYGTASNYDFSLRSIKKYKNHTSGREISSLAFVEVNPKFLQGYESYMLSTLERSRTSVSMYLRALKAVFNAAIEEKEINPEIYPFGTRKYQIPSANSVKKALNQSEIKLLYSATTNNEFQEKARDFWFLSFLCYGINIKDIAYLKYSNIQKQCLYYYRAKTINTTKKELKPVIVPLVPQAIKIIEKYGNKDKKPKQYIFSIINDEMNEETKNISVHNFTRFINQHIKELAKKLELSNEISTYWARHSYATIAIRNGASTEEVSEALNHSSLKTTKGYIAGLEDNVKAEKQEKLMGFLT